MTQEKKHSSRGRALEITLHLLTWICIFVSPLLFRREDTSFSWTRYLQGSLFPLSLCILFYLNYLLFVPRFILKKRYNRFIIYNVIFYIVACLLLQQAFEWFPPDKMPRLPMKHHTPPPVWLFPLRHLLTFVFATATAVAFRLSMQWRKAELGLQEAELGRTAAELQNLKNQINPHFLLNTLNNIYALTAFNTEKAQQAILELSRLLRYMLYENQAPFVPLRKEADFLQAYIELMRIRMGANVDIRVNINLPPDDDTPVAPLIFISLVENAFKHGISPTHPSFVHISLSVTDGDIRFTETNSNFPKNESDKAGSGIGLQQVKRRLELSYPDCHTWHHGTTENGAVYISSILIHTSKPLSL